MSNLKHKIPNYLTIMRVLLVPALVLAFYFEKDIYKPYLFFIFVVACITDFFDGYLSRKWEVTSRFGAMLDPIADKLIVIVALCLIITTEEILLIPTVVIICREIFISGLREFLGKVEGVEMPVTNLAKWKTASQMVGISLVLLVTGNDVLTGLPYFIYLIGSFIVLVSSIITGYTGWLYYSFSRKNSLI